MYKNKPIQAYISEIEIRIKEKGTAVFYYWESTEGITNGFFASEKSLFFSKEDLLNSL